MMIPDKDRGKAPGQVPEDFTDRKPHLEVFRRVLAAPEGEAMRVLAFHGVGGRGKTRLLDKLADELDRLQPPMPHARFDVANLRSPATAAREVLLRLRSDLESRFRLTFPRFDLLLSVLLTAEGGPPPPLVVHPCYRLLQSPGTDVRDLGYRLSFLQFPDKSCTDCPMSFPSTSTRFSPYLVHI
jgi:hypothetical protein